MFLAQFCGVVYGESDKYRFAEGGVFPRFATPSFKSEARKLASVEPGGLQKGEILGPSLKQYLSDSPYTTYNNGEGEGHQLETNEPAVIPLEHKRCFEQQTSAPNNQTTVNFPISFNTSLQSFVR